MSEENDVIATESTTMEPATDVASPSEENSDIPAENTEAPEISSDDDEDLPPHLQRKIGKIISKERKRLEAKFSRQVNPASVQAAPEGTIFDPQIGEYVDLNSVPGQMAWREQLAQQKRAKDVEAQQQALRQHEYEELTDKLSEGHEKYDNYQQSLQNFSNLATQEMADALCGIDRPDALIAYLGDKKGEIQRISRLKPAQQLREMFRLEEKLTPRKKLISNAPAPVSKVKASQGQAPVSRENWTAAQRDAYYEQKFNSR